jgi:hypothetical protein
MRKFVVVLALASVFVASSGVASAQYRPRTGASSVDRHPQPQVPKTADEVMSPLSTAERAQKLRKADLETRKAFGDYQAVVAEARRDGDATDAAAADLLAVQAQSATRAQIARFGEDTDERVRQLEGVERATRRAFDKFQATFWRQQDLVAAAGAEAEMAAFGQVTGAQATATVPASQEAGDKDH